MKFFINKWSYRNLGTDFIEFKEFFDDAEKNKLTDDVKNIYTDFVFFHQNNLFKF